AVDGPTFFAVVVRHRAGLAEANGIDPAGLDAELAHQHFTHGHGPTLGKTLVVGLGAHRIGVSFHHRGGLRELLHELRYVADIRVAFRLDDLTVEIEFHIQLDPQGLRGCWLDDFLFDLHQRHDLLFLALALRPAIAARRGSGDQRAPTRVAAALEGAER